MLVRYWARREGEREREAGNVHVCCAAFAHAQMMSGEGNGATHPCSRRSKGPLPSHHPIRDAVRVAARAVPSESERGRV
jgi:hypothetical protein